jgi:hypothetical protein
MPASGEYGDVERCVAGSGRVASEVDSDSSGPPHATSNTATSNTESENTATEARVTSRRIVGAFRRSSRARITACYWQDQSSQRTAPQPWRDLSEAMLREHPGRAGPSAAPMREQPAEAELPCYLDGRRKKRADVARIVVPGRSREQQRGFVGVVVVHRHPRTRDPLALRCSKKHGATVLEVVRLNEVRESIVPRVVLPYAHGPIMPQHFRFDAGGAVGASLCQSRARLHGVTIAARGCDPFQCLA